LDWKLCIGKKGRGGFVVAVVTIVGKKSGDDGNPVCATGPGILPS